MTGFTVFDVSSQHCENAKTFEQVELLKTFTGAIYVLYRFVFIICSHLYSGKK